MPLGDNQSGQKTLQFFLKTMESIKKILTDKVVSLFEDRVLTWLREKYFTERAVSATGAKRVFESYRYFFKLENFKIINRFLPQFKAEKSTMSWLPTNKTIEVNLPIKTTDIALPSKVLDHFIEKASHRVIVNFCGCRKAMGCNQYNHNLGCLMMGESALLIPKISRREVGIEEAKEHVKKAIGSGLIPLTGKARIDNDIFMIPDRGKLMTVCFCCECCCIARFTQDITLEALENINPTVEGLSIEVTDKCTACGTCLSKCYIDAINIVDDRAVIGARCRICGRCAKHCEQKAIKLKIDNVNAAQDVINRIETYVDVT